VVYMGVFTGYSKTGYNTTTLGTEGRTGSSVALGRIRSTVGSITRTYNYYNRINPNPRVAFALTFPKK
jgi:hypothetical protein